MQDRPVRGGIDSQLYVCVRPGNIKDTELGDLIIKAQHTGDCHYRFVKVAYNNESGTLKPDMGGSKDGLPIEHSGYEELPAFKLTKLQHRQLLAGLTVVLDTTVNESLLLRVQELAPVVFDARRAHEQHRAEFEAIQQRARQGEV